MMNPNCDPLALITAVNTLAVAIAGRLNDEELDLTAGMEPISLSDKGEFKVYDPEREDTALFVIVREEDEDYWK